MAWRRLLMVKANATDSILHRMIQSIIGGLVSGTRLAPTFSRRSFLRGLAGAVGGIAIEQAIPLAIPLGRVWSFPKEIVAGQYADFVNFRDLQFELAIDPIIARLAAELNYRMALTVRSLVEVTCDADRLSRRSGSTFRLPIRATTFFSAEPMCMPVGL
jgi:hypothetical protein